MKRLSKIIQNLINKYVENSLQHIKESNPQDGGRESASGEITFGKRTSAKTRGQGMRSTHILCSIIIAILFINCQRLPQRPFVAVNLLGYNSDDPKQTLLVNDDATRFEIIDPVNSELVYEGIITKPVSSDPSTGDRASLIDFSDFGSKGYFKLQVKDQSEIKSQQFMIGSNLYKDATLAAVQGYNYTQYGMSVENGTSWKHLLSHLEDAVFYDGPTLRKDVSGVWYDSGDYNNTVLSVGLLLKLYEMRSGMVLDGQKGAQSKLMNEVIITAGS